MVRNTGARSFVAGVALAAVVSAVLSQGSDCVAVPNIFVVLLVTMLPKSSCC